MSMVRAVDITGDWVFGLGKAGYKTKGHSLSQQITGRLKSYTNDCFFDMEAGLDWFNLLGSKDLTALRLAVSSVILNTYGVTGIRELDFTLDRASRALTITWAAESVYGTVKGNYAVTV